ncbi:hypothetical protein ZIOFF_005382 [Zingiber officinale]|uniref:Aldehyde dehydrogenase 1 n=1 Tax=Zingiber officinale TaxID=94328 RepID=A0A8J5M4A8_ZINOF|nr:hypothetical protein ZIOFF_005382 [Zingiber officinale]
MGSELKKPEIKFTKLFINGDFVDAVSGRTFETIDPRTGDVITMVAEGDKEDVDLAVDAAREAFDHGKWPRLTGCERGKIMMKFADLIEQHVEEIATLDALEVGKLFLLNKLYDVPSSADMLRYFAGAADKIHGQTLKMSGAMHGYTLKEPIGVVGLIIPWNFPAAMFFFKVAPALAAGCTMVVKPSEQSSLSALYIAHLAKQAGIPDGVLNVVSGFGPTAGAAIASHMDINHGEVCVAASRVYVQEGIYDEFVEKAVASVKYWKIGDPFDPEVHQGPQADKKQFERILGCIEQGKKEGATILTGGKAWGEKGYYIEPTIFANVTEDMVIAKEEIFGPVMSLMKFKTIEEAIQKANNTKYGLAAGIVTKNLDIANRMSRSVRAGNIWINCYSALDRNLPFGGFKMSGFGKDLGIDSVEKYMQIKAVVTPLYDSPWL